MTEDTSGHSCDGVAASGYGRRRFIAVGSGVGAALLAGCTSDDSGGDGTPTDDGSGGGGSTSNFRLLVSDAPADIDDFDRLDVTFNRARVFEGGDGEDEGTDEEGTENGTETENETSGEMTETVEEDEQTNETDAENGTETENGTATETENDSETENGTETDAEDDGEGGDGEGGRGFYVLELDSPTVDLTKVVGDVAQPIFDGELEAGSYQKLELHVADVEGVVDGEEVEVKVPSEKLQLTKPFEVRAGEELDFVFDINVVKRGNQASYNLKPVISQSGVRGEDVEVEEVGDEGEDDGSEEGAGSNGSDDEGGAGGDAGNETDDDETGGAGDETGGNETGGNESAA